MLSHNTPHVARVRGHNDFSKAMDSQRCVAKSIPRFTTYRKFVFQPESVVNTIAKRTKYYVSSYVAASMVVQRAHWTRLEKHTGSIGSFLIRDIDLTKIHPNLCIKLFEHDAEQMRKRLHSVETRIQDRQKFEELLQNIETLENDTVGFPEGSPKLLLQKPLAVKDPVILSDGSESDDEQTYCVGDMVTVRHRKSNGATPFWVGAITGKSSIEVGWFDIVPEAKFKSAQIERTDSEYCRRDSCYTARYSPCLGTSNDRLCDEISTKSILVHFDKLTSTSTLPILVQKMTMQALDPFAEYEGKDEK